MSTRYDDRDYERDPRDHRRRERESSRYSDDYEEPRRRYRSRSYERDDDWYDRERRRESEYNDRYPLGREYESRTSGNYYQPRYNYPTGFRTGERYDEGYRDYDRNYERDFDRDYDSEAGRAGWSGKRDWFDRASDEVASWFGDRGAKERRRFDEQRAHLRGRGPKGYRRSDERIKEDVNDRLSDGYLDATDIDVAVANGDVTLTGSVFSRIDKRRAEDLAESVSGVTNVENRLRVRPSVLGSPRDKLIGDQPSITQTDTTTAKPGSETGRAKTAGS